MSIYICGFMGSGKTTLRKRLLEKEERPGFDFDEELEKRNLLKKGELGKLIERIGWEEFRNKEIELFKDSLDETKGLYSLGGGTACIQGFEELVQNNDHVEILWLNTAVEKCWERVSKDLSRPLVKNGKDAFYKLYQERIKFYRNYKEIDDNYIIER